MQIEMVLGLCKCNRTTPPSLLLMQAEQNYAQIEKELLSVVFTLEKFHMHTYNTPGTVQNDHKPLVSIQSKPISKSTMCLQRMLVRLQKYSFTIDYTPGNDLHLEDVLSRACVPIVQ